MLLSEFAHVVSPWRHTPIGGSVVANQGVLGLAGIGSAAHDGRESEDLFGSLWFAVPKKRVSKFCLESVILAWQVLCNDNTSQRYSSTLYRNHYSTMHCDNISKA